MSTAMVCGWCQAEIPADAARCPKCQGDVAAGKRFAGAAESSPSPAARPSSTAQPAVQVVRFPKVSPLPWSHRPEAFIIVAIVVATFFGVAAGSAAATDSSGAGALLAIGSLAAGPVLLIGLIAKGVELGIRAARHRQDLEF